MTISEGQKKAIAGGSALAIPPILYGIIDLVYFPTLTKLKANPGISEFTANRIAVGSAIDAVIFISALIVFSYTFVKTVLNTVEEENSNGS